MDLSGRVALVTGAAVGIGRATARALASAGAFVGLHFHARRGEAEEVLALLEKQGGRVCVLIHGFTVSVIVVLGAPCSNR